MRAVVMTAVGGPEVLKLVELPDPKLEGEHDVLVRLRAAGVNPVDYKLRSRGTIGGSLPAVLGWDGSGVVERTAPAVTRVGIGDEVYFCDGGFGPTPGTYEELKVVHEDYLAKKPSNLSFVEAAAAPLVTITAWEALHGRVRVSEGQFVLVQAGAGGVGHMSVQIARLAGARVATTVSPGPKTELASSLGAGLCIDYRHEDVAARLRAWTGMDGADVVHDTVGGQTFTASFSLVRPYGDLVTNVESRVGAGGAQSDARPEPPRLLHLDAVPIGVRVARAQTASAWGARRGGEAFRSRRPTRSGWGDIPPGTGGRSATRTGGRPGHGQGRPHYVVTGGMVRPGYEVDLLRFYAPPVTLWGPGFPPPTSATPAPLQPTP